MPNAGARILAADVTAAATKGTHKAASQSITSSTTLTADADFSTFLDVGTYRVELFVHYTGDPAGDIKLSWTFSGTLNGAFRSCMGPTINATDPAGTATPAVTVGVLRTTGHGIGTSIPYGGTSTTAIIHEDLYLEVTVAGTLVLTWAQNTSNAVASTFSSASRTYVTKIG
jgi:hypothetical protein